MSTAKSWKGSQGLRGASIGDSRSDTSDLLAAYSTLKSRQDLAEKPATPAVTVNYQDWTGLTMEEDSKSLSSTSWMEALKEVRKRSREKKR